jgi:hypothetical protein
VHCGILFKNASAHEFILLSMPRPINTAKTKSPKLHSAQAMNQICKAPRSIKLPPAPALPLPGVAAEEASPPLLPEGAFLSFGIPIALRELLFAAHAKVGRMEGRKEGRKDRRKEGRKEGRNEGRKEGTKERKIYRYCI